MNRLFSYTQLIIYVACMLLMQACASDDPAESSETSRGGIALRVTARVADHVYTRGYQESGLVESGNYYLSYPANTSDRGYTLAIVDFDSQSDVTPGLGIVSTLSGTELKWSEIGGSPVTFYLDNVDENFGTGPVVTFDGSSNPFSAGLFDSETGSNDLLWGEKAVNSGTRSLGFDLHHNMSRVKVQVEIIHEDNSIEEISLEGATVKITSLYTTPVSYNRMDGTLSLDEESQNEVTIVDSSLSGYDWAEKDETDDNRTVYLSQDIVLPPQALAEDETRSRLVITLADGTVYSGILPHAMMIANSTDSSLTYPVTLAFLKEYVMTIRTVITEEPPQLAFMPVWVVDWVDKGEFTLEAHQSGVYTADEFYRLTSYYTQLNEYQLVRYGYLFVPEDSDEKVWHFDFFSGVALDFDKIQGSMIPNQFVKDKGYTKEFVFAFNNYPVAVYKGDPSNAVQVNSRQLYEIVTGRLSWQQLTN